MLLPPSGLSQGPSSSSSTAAVAAAAAGAPYIVRGVAATLLHYASTEDGAAELVKPGGSFLQDAHRTLRSCQLSCRKEHEPQQQKQAQQERLAGLLQLLAVIAGRPKGQQAMLRPTVAPALVDLLVEVLLLPQQPAAVAAALLLLHNLSFNAELRSPALASQQLLPLLLAAAESLAPPQQQQQQLLLEIGGLSRPGSSGADSAAGGWAPLYGKPVTSAAAASGPLSRFAGGSGSRPGSPAVASAGAVAAAIVPSAAANVCCAVYAVSALWGLMYQGEKVKAALRKLPGAAARLEAVRDQAQLLLQQHREAAAAAVQGREDANAVKLLEIGKSGPKDTAAVADRGTAIAAAASTATARKSEIGNLGAGSAGASGKESGVLVKPACLSCMRDAGWWLQQLVDSCTSVLDIMDSV